MLSRKDFDAMVARAVEGIPKKFRERIKNVAILVEDEPSAAVRVSEGLDGDETLLGLYHGVPATLRGEGYGVGPTLPDTITLFQTPIEEAGGGEPALIEEVIRDTIWHEYAHYFGMDEGEVQKWEDERGGTT